MVCEHQDCCVECLRAEHKAELAGRDAELESIRAQRDALVTGIQELLGQKASKASKAWQPFITPALTPPDSPNSKEKAEADAPVVLPTSSTIIWRKKKPPTEEPTAAEKAEEPKTETSTKQEAVVTVSSTYENPWEATLNTAETMRGLIMEAAQAESRRRNGKKPAPKEKKAQKPKAKGKPAPKPAKPAKPRAKSGEKERKQAPAPKSPKGFIRLLEVAQRARTTVNSVISDINSGKLPAIKDYAGIVLVKRADAQKYVTKQAKTQ